MENGLTDTIKLLKIYDMSLPRASAHHTCHRAPVRNSWVGCGTKVSTTSFRDQNCTHDRVALRHGTAGLVPQLI